MSKSFFLYALTAALLANSSGVATPQTISGIEYTYPADHLKLGQSYGNQDCYVTLDGKTDVAGGQGTVRFGLRESTNQKYYLLAWGVSVATLRGEVLRPVTTVFSPSSQKTELRHGGIAVEKSLFVPFENGYERSAHFLLHAADGTEIPLVIQTRMLLPSGAKIEKAVYKGHEYLRIRYLDGAESVLWGSDGLQSMEAQVTSALGNPVQVAATFNWTPTLSHHDYALSFAYALAGSSNSEQMLLNALFDTFDAESPSPATHLERIHKLLEDSDIAINRYLETTRLWTPDEVVNRGFQWAKINQLRMQQAYKWGSGFSNNPPTDIVVARDSVWYLMGSSYYAQAWSRRLLNFWFQYGLELNGKFVEYLTASQDPLFRDDYGLNINDNTPLMIMAAHHYYSLTGDQGFLRAVYPSLLQSANYILSQRTVGKNNRYDLVWCATTETFVRGLCGWRNAIQGYNLAGAVTEVNAECYQALLATAELAKEMGDEPNRARLVAAAEDLRQTIEKHLRSSEPSNPFYYLNINPAGRPVDDVTADLLFPVLFGVTDPATGRAILQDLFGPQFWAESPNGAGGIRTVSSAQAGYQAVSTPENYGLLGGVWPNVALWAAKAAGAEGLPDLALKGLRGTFLLTEREDPIHFNVVAGEFPEYFNGNDLVQKGMPLSPFVPGIYIWSGLEGLFGLSPHPAGLDVNPVFPKTWTWMAVSKMPYHGDPLTLLAISKERTLYTTAPVVSSWKQVVVPESLQQQFKFVSDKPAFWLVIPTTEGNEIIAASNVQTTAKLLDLKTGHVVADLSIPAGDLIRESLH